MSTTVISVRGQDRKALQADSSFAYVGRRCAGWPDTPWGNPFRVDRLGLRIDFGRVDLRWWAEAATVDPAHSPIERAVDLYKQWFTQCRVDLVKRLPELAGKRLGCWCCCWAPGDPFQACHAIVLATLAQIMVPSEVR